MCGWCRPVAMNLTSPLSRCSTVLTACRATEDGASPESERATDVDDAKIEEVLYTVTAKASGRNWYQF